MKALSSEISVMTYHETRLFGMGKPQSFNVMDSGVSIESRVSGFRTVSKVFSLDNDQFERHFSRLREILLFSVQCE